MLEERSAFFKAALAGAWMSTTREEQETESSQGKEKGKDAEQSIQTVDPCQVDFDNTEPVIFGIFLTWILTGNLRNSGNLINNVDDDPEVRPQQWKQLVDCYILGDFLQAPGFKNSVMDELLRVLEARNDTAGLPRAAIEYIFKNTVHGAALRQLVLHLVHVNGTFPALEDREFCYELAQYLMSDAVKHAKNPSQPWKRAKCEYHEHPDQSAGYTCTNVPRKRQW